MFIYVTGYMSVTGSYNFYASYSLFPLPPENTLTVHGSLARVQNLLSWRLWVISSPVGTGLFRVPLTFIHRTREY